MQENDECERKKECTQTPTEASSQMHIETHDLEYIAKAEEQSLSKKEDNRLKKIKQKLANITYSHDDKVPGNKDISNPNRQRVMKLALDFQKQMRNQSRDYYQMEVQLRELLKILQNKNQQDLNLVCQSHFIPAFFELLQKTSMLHKTEFLQLLKTLQLGLKILQFISSISTIVNYLILTNRLKNLVTFIGWLLSRQDKKGFSSFNQFTVRLYCFKLINSLLSHRSKSEEVNKIVQVTMFYSLSPFLLRRIRSHNSLQNYVDGMLPEGEVLVEGMKFTYLIIHQSRYKQQTVHSLKGYCPETKESPEKTTSSELLVRMIDIILPSLVAYFSAIIDYETEDEVPEFFPNSAMNLMLLTLKSINGCFGACFLAFKRVILEIDKDNSLTSFISKLKIMAACCKNNFDKEPMQAQALLNQIIVLSGYLALDDPGLQKKIHDTELLKELLDLPLPYMMDANLREVIIPTFCCLLHQNKANLNLFLKQYSQVHISKFLKKEIEVKPSLVRKNSTVSLFNFNNDGTDPETQRNHLSMRFPTSYWEQFCSELEKHA